MFLVYIPSNTPIDNKIIKGLLRPNFNLQRSLSEPKIGVTKKPISGDNAQTNVMCL